MAEESLQVMGSLELSDTVALVTNIPRPYRRPLFGLLGQRFAGEGLDLRVLYTSDPTKHVRRGSPSAEVAYPEMEEYVHSVSLGLRYDRVLSLPTGLGRTLSSHEPACVIVGGFGPAAMACARWCQKARVPRVIWSGAWPGKGGGVGPVPRMIRRWLVRDADAFIAYGTAAGDYLVSLGAPRERVFNAWNTVDLENMASAAHAAATSRAELTAKYRLAPRNLLYVGSIVESKGLHELLSAAMALPPDHADWALHLVGSGPLWAGLEARARAAGKEARLRFHGLRPPSEVAELLGLVDGLILPTKREAWGLVINEAMACGVPVVASPWAGATRDLIVDGVTGYVVDPADTAKLAEVMARLLSGDPVPRAVGLAGAEAVRAKASLEKSAEGFVAAVKCAMATRVHA